MDEPFATNAFLLRRLGQEPPFSVSVTAPPAALSWPATAGRSYDVLTATGPQGPFQVQASLIPSGGLARWVDTNAPARQRWYRIRTSK